MSGNEDLLFIEERRTLLERFLRELAKNDYIIESKEFRIFSRALGEVDKQLTGLSKQSAMAILEKYRLNFKIDEDQDQSEIGRYREKINNFSNFIRKAMVQVEVRLDTMFSDFKLCILFTAPKVRHKDLHESTIPIIPKLREVLRERAEV